MGVKKLPIDWKMVEQYCIAGCSGMEIAAKIGIHHETLYKRCIRDKKMNFSEFSHKKKQKGDSLLKVKQFDVAMSGDRQMLIWLGKNRMGQSDKMDTRISGEVEIKKKIVLKLPDNGRRYVEVQVEDQE